MQSLNASLCRKDFFKVHCTTVFDYSQKDCSFCIKHWDIYVGVQINECIDISKHMHIITHTYTCVSRNIYWLLVNNSNERKSKF